MSTELTQAWIMVFFCVAVVFWLRGPLSLSAWSFAVVPVVVFVGSVVGITESHFWTDVCIALCLLGLVIALANAELFISIFRGDFDE